MSEELKETIEVIEQNPEPEAEPVKTAEEQLAELRVEMARLKKANDKLSSESAGYKRQLRERQSADEIALQEKAEREAEREERYQNLLRENTIGKYEKHFLKLGYSGDLAIKAATAQYDNDMDSLFAIQAKATEEHDKAYKARLIQEMPISPISNQGEEEDDPFLKGWSKK